jgi:hypothetical protein
VQGANSVRPSSTASGRPSASANSTEPFDYPDSLPASRGAGSIFRERLAQFDLLTSHLEAKSLASPEFVVALLAEYG